MIKQTTDYDLFKKHDGNRNILSSNLKRIVASIKVKNLLHLRPILVNKDMEILDGQHRLEAAKMLGLPIHYEVHKDCDLSDIPRLNVQAAWKKEDILNFYTSQGNPHYIALYEQTKNLNVPFHFALKMFPSAGEKLQTKDKTAKLFVDGEYIFPSGAELGGIIDMLSKIRCVQEYLRPRLCALSYTKFIDSTGFAHALRSFFEIRSVEYDHFMKKLELRLDLMRPCHNVRSYIQLFKTIYNFKNRNPLAMEEDYMIVENA